MENRSLVGSVFERKPSSSPPNISTNFSSTKTGFPPVKHRSQSAFARSRQQLRGKSEEAGPSSRPVTVPPIRHDQSATGLSPPSTRTNDLDVMKQQISTENEQKLGEMPAEEIERERKEIVERFGSGINDLLRRVHEARQRQGAKKPQDARPDKINTNVSPDMDEDTLPETPIVSPRLEEKSLSRTGSVSPPPPALLQNGSRPSSRADRRLRFAELSPNDVHVYPSAPSSPKRKALALPPPDPSDSSVISLGTYNTEHTTPDQHIAQIEEGTPEDIRRRFFPNIPAGDPNLAWMAPTPQSEPSASSAIRFDLTGTPIPTNLTSTLPTHLGLHHHAEGSLAGYTLDDIFLLSRSSVSAQRATMLGVLSQIAVKLRDMQNGHPDPNLHPLQGQEDSLRKRILAAGLEAIGERGSLGARAVRVVWQCTAGWDPEVFQVQRLEIRPEDPSQDAIESLPLGQLLLQLSTVFAAKDLPHESLAQLLAVCHRIALVSNDAATQIVKTKSLVTGIVQTFLTCAQEHVDVAALHFLIVLAQSSRTNAITIADVADLLLRFLVITDHNHPNLVRLTLIFYTTLASYGLYCHIATIAAEPLSRLSGTVMTDTVMPNTLPLKQAWAELVHAWTVCATNPHQTTPAHEILWSQISSWAWHNDVLSSCGDLGSDIGTWQVWTASWRACAAWLEGARINGVRGGQGERDATRQTLQAMFSRGSSGQVVVEGALSQLKSVLEDGVSAIQKFSSPCEPLSAVLQLWVACCSSAELKSALLEPPFLLPFPEISSICARLVAHPIWDLNPRPSSGQAMTSLLAHFTRFSKLLPDTTVDVWLAQVFSIIHRLLPGDQEFGQDLLSQAIHQLTPELLISRGVNVPPIVQQSGGLAITKPFFTYAFQGQNYYGPHIPSVESIKKSTTLRVPNRPMSDSRAIPGGLPVGLDWTFTPLDHLLRSASSPVFKSPPEGWDASEIEIVRATLLFAKITRDVLVSFGLGIFTPSLEEVVFNCMKVFMLEHERSDDQAPQEVFRDPVVSAAMNDVLAPYTFNPLASPSPTVSHNIEQIAERFLGKSTPFFQYYTDFVALYDAVSFSDPTFARLLLVPTSMRYPIDYRRHLWNDFSHVLKTINVSFHSVIGNDISEFLWPVEQDNQMLTAYLSALSKGGLSGFLRFIAVHHLTFNIWPDLTPAGEMQDKERGQKLLKTILNIADEDIIANILRYKQAKTVLLPPACFPDKGTWKIERLEYLDSCIKNAPERLRALLQ